MKVACLQNLLLNFCNVSSIDIIFRPVVFMNELLKFQCELSNILPWIYSSPPTCQMLLTGWWSRIDLCSLITDSRYRPISHFSIFLELAICSPRRFISRKAHMDLVTSENGFQKITETQSHFIDIQTVLVSVIWIHNGSKNKDTWSTILNWYMKLTI